jgi:protein-tyrosine-phosphatase
MTVHFICRGNVFRSFMAEAYLKSLKLPGVHVMSSGTVADRDRDFNAENLAAAREVLISHGLGEYAKEFPEQLTPDRLLEGDITICMNGRVREECETGICKLPANALVWDVMDLGEQPESLLRGVDQMAFREQTFARITRLVDELVETKLAPGKVS